MKARSEGGFASNPEGLVKLGCALMESGRGGQAVSLIAGLIAANPDDRLLHEAAGIVLTHRVPDFHRPMLADTARNEAYERAIVRAAPGRTVLDIGAGSGLLAMMAARAGAAHVYACEGNEALAATARDIVTANGFGDRITVLAKNSSALDPVADLGGGVDLVISEIFSHHLIGEGALPSLRDAMARLASPGAAIIPARGSAIVALAERREAGPNAETVSGFDLSLFRRHVATTVNVPVGDKRLALRSEPAVLFSFDFTKAEDVGDAPARVRAICSGGSANGIAQWIQLELDAEDIYDNRPGPGASSHWATVFHPSAAEIAEDNAVDIVGWHDNYRLRVWSEGVPGASPSR